MSHCLDHTGDKERLMDKNLPLPPWYDAMLSCPVKMTLFFVVVMALSPILLIFGAVLPLFRKYL
jgi:hypothetical protein